MRKVGRCWILASAVVATGFCMPVIASAATTFGAEVFGGYNQYAMGDVNDAIQADFGTGFDELSGGISGGLGLRAWANPNWMFSTAWEILPLQTESGTTTINLNSHAFQGTAAYFFPSTTPNARYGLGAGVGYYVLGGSFEDSSDPTAAGDIDGNGFGLHALGMGEWQVNPSFAVNASAGYRYADFEIEDGSGNTADYSGLMGRVGFAFYFPTAK